MSDAMAFESASKLYGIPGRVIPVPSEVDAGCGMSWSAPVDQRGDLEAAIEEHGLANAGIHVVNLY
ncbi:MAG: DUF3343 domain-containing protein [Eggerthellaceae bacterium]|nr:DUF3343 domain-containing protein [Eggerthellaceae bacterium]